jgi:Starch-binding associating with outer membrane
MKMKMKTIKKIIGFLCVVSLLSSCDNLTDLNENPSFPTDVSAIALLPAIEQQMAVGLQFDTRAIGPYTQYLSGTTAFSTASNWERYGYTPASDFGGEIWKMAYFAIGLNLSRVLEKAEEEKRYDILGAGKVIRAWSWQVATDYHSELIDFNQVFTQRQTFDYVSQETTYGVTKALLLEGIAELNRTDGLVSQPYFARGDFMYGGDRAKWKKFAYGILARRANNLINKAGYDPDEVINYCNLSLASNADNAVIKYNGTIGADSNFFGPTRNNFGTFRQTDFLVRTLNGTIFTGAIDPRMSRIISPSKGASETLPATAAAPNISLYTYNGNPANTTITTTGAATNIIPNLWGEFGVAGNVAQPGRYIFRDKADFPIMTYAEIQFIKAEAAFIKGDKVTALAAYTAGISASIDLVNNLTVVRPTFPVTSTISAAEKTAFLANVNVVPTLPANLTLSNIMLQKYIALFGFGSLETWTDLRKYHYDPAVYTSFNTAVAGGLYVDNGGLLPYRVRPRYNSEYLWNIDALNAIGGFNPNYHTQEMWFSKP